MRFVVNFVFLFCALFFVHAQKIKVEYIAHASFKISYNEKSLLIDPFADTTWIGYKFPKNIRADAALISHPHYDHDGGRFRGVTPYWEDQLEIIEDPGDFQIVFVHELVCFSVRNGGVQRLEYHIRGWRDREAERIDGSLYVFSAHKITHQPQFLG